MTPERKARGGMDVLLVAAGMHVCDVETGLQNHDRRTLQGYYMRIRRFA